MSQAAAAPVRSLLALLTLPWILGACAGSLFKNEVAPPTRYLLSAESAAPAAPAAGADGPGAGSNPDLAVLRPRIRAGLDTERIAVLYPDRRLDYFADVRWSGPLEEVVQDLAVQSLHSRGGLRNVSGDASQFASTYWLEIEVADFQAEYAQVSPLSAAPPTVHVHFLAKLGSSAERRIIARCEAQVREPAASNRMGAIVAAYDLAANQALARIAADCMAALAATPAPR